MEVNKRFPVLSSLAKLLFIVGLIDFICGLFFGGREAIEFSKIAGKAGSDWSFETKDFINIALFIFCTVGGLVTMAIAEITGVFFAIEKNTRTNTLD
jgi:hypothetical protein